MDAGVDLVSTARGLVPMLAAQADEAERLGRLPDETVEALNDSGLLLLTVPARFGGYQAGGAVYQGVLEELARGCTSTSFVANVYMTAAYMVGSMSDAAKEDFFSSENSRSFIALNPGGGATPTDEGYVVGGRWPFCTGQHHSGWGLVSALTSGSDGQVDIGFFMVPRANFESAHDWQVTGLVGTGSDTLTLPETLVPAHRALLLSDIQAGRYRSAVAAESAYYQKPWSAFPFAGFAGPPLGVARAAVDILRDRVGRRGITYSKYLCQADAPVTHLQMAEITMKLDEARFHAQRLVETAKRHDQDLDAEVQARNFADCAWTVRLCREAVDIVQIASGASAIHRRDPLQRMIRDMQALSVHALVLGTTNAELYGRVLCGRDPETPFVGS